MRGRTGMLKGARGEGQEKTLDSGLGTALSRRRARTMILCFRFNFLPLAPWPSPLAKRLAIRTEVRGTSSEPHALHDSLANGTRFPSAAIHRKLVLKDAPQTGASDVVADGRDSRLN